MPISSSPAIKSGLCPPGANPRTIPSTRIQALAPPGLNFLASQGGMKLPGLSQPDLAFVATRSNGTKEQILKPLSQGAFLIGP